MNFASDNTAGIAPDILERAGAANEGFALGYGNDELTRAVERRIGEMFEREVAVFLVPTGTAANALALAHVTPPWGGVLCHARSAHRHRRMRRAGILRRRAEADRPAGRGLQARAARRCATRSTRYAGHAPHQVNAAALSLTQATEAGTIYRPDEIAALAEIAHAHGHARAHGRRALRQCAGAHECVARREATWKAGVDVLSFGATKGGAMAAEAVVFFDPRAGRAHGRAAQARRTSPLQAPLPRRAIRGFLDDDCWLPLARHANAMADLLAAGLRRPAQPVWPVEANLVFAACRRRSTRASRRPARRYYVRTSDSLPAGLKIRQDECWCGWSPRLRHRRPRSIISWMSFAKA